MTLDAVDTSYCADCDDSGWKPLVCSGRGDRFTSQPRNPHSDPIYPCARMQTHPAHSYVDPCACRETNPVIARKRAAMRPKEAIS